MKKYLVIMMCGGLLLTTTGCGNKVEEKEDSKENTTTEEKATSKILSCTETQEDLDMKMRLNFVYDLDGKSFSKTTLEIIEKTDDELSNEDYKELADNFCEDYDSDIYKSCKGDVNGGEFTVTVDIDIDKLEESEQGFTKNTPIEEMKGIVEDSSSSVTCKIEEK